MNDLTSALLDLGEDRPLRIVYGTATDVNTVTLAGAATAVTLPALTPVGAGQYAAVLVAGADRLILGPVGGAAGPQINPTVTNETGWSTTVQQCRRIGPMLALFFTIERTGANHSTTTQLTVATLDSTARGNSTMTWPVPGGYTTGIAAPPASDITCRYNPSTGVIDMRQFEGTWASGGTKHFGGVITVDVT